MNAEAVYTISDSNESGVIHLDLLSGVAEMMFWEHKRFLFWKTREIQWDMRLIYMKAYLPTWSTCVCTGTGIIAITDINLN